MKILFYGRTQHNSGPENVNKAFYAHLSDLFLPASPQGEILRDLFKLLRCDAVVVSGLSRKACLLTAAGNLLGKKTFCLLHGCAAYEQRLNRQENPGPVRQERFLHKNCRRVLTVSRRYGNWLARQYPHLEHKLDWVNPGLPEMTVCQNTEKQKASVLAAGADRPMKNNLPLARAVEELDGAFSLEICGTSYHGDPFAPFRHTQYLGLLPREEFWAKLEKTEIFVVNSTVESFGISPLEALARGCSLLVSENCGICDLLPLEDTDIIHDPMDTEELKNKLKWIHDHPNNHRLQPKPWTWEDAVARLEMICRKEAGS